MSSDPRTLNEGMVPGAPTCNCGRDDGTRTHTAYEGNLGGHAISCPKRDWSNQEEIKVRYKHEYRDAVRGGRSFYDVHPDDRPETYYPDTDGRDPLG